MALCNICGGSAFHDFGERKKVLCTGCQSLERHRLIRVVLQALDYLSYENSHGKKRVLHLAPEAATHSYLFSVFGSGYYAADLTPSRYPHAQTLKLALPRGFDIFPDNYFDLIVHNHVLEHIPGNYQHHIRRFAEILKPGGRMVFTIPAIRMDSLTVEGGENLPTDEARLRAHGQADHLKTFGRDFLDYMDSLQGGTFETASVSNDVRQEVIAPNDPVFVFQKSLTSF
jgi:SAM-dependent methyltransferase